MKPREEQQQEPKAARVRKQARKPKLRIVKLEPRIAPVGCPTWMCGSGNHNETLVRDQA
jgi:hypothetical protein